ncbi:hypothetical protein E2C01_047280 [Portunus trituberculatus]|uniref:Uncharacterized protein n=1 Tax=Portunus trituberculatus TaxID=210409 RepID=A0A5B7G0Q0_PORTR|nr:hypothetical protein [Portunus trituberculatus]
MKLSLTFPDYEAYALSLLPHPSSTPLTLLQYHHHHHHHDHHHQLLNVSIPFARDTSPPLTQI